MSGDHVSPSVLRRMAQAEHQWGWAAMRNQFPTQAPHTTICAACDSYLTQALAVEQQRAANVMQQRRRLGIPRR